MSDDVALSPEFIAELRARNTAHATTLKQRERDRLDEMRQVMQRVFREPIKFSVTSSDQGRYGYWLVDITDGHEGSFEEGNPRFDEVLAEVEDDLGDLNWGVFGDTNADSSFEVDVDTLRIIR